MDLDTKELVSLSPGSIIGGRYQIIRCLGIGSMGMVYLARTVSGGTPLCAIKVLSPSDTHTGSYQNFLARFRNEVQAARRVRHPNVVQIYDCIDDELITACAMEYVGGGDLSQLIRKRAAAFPVGEAIRLMREMCAGVEAIHRAGIIHRDIKPANMLLSEQGQIKISDFGLARTDESPKLTARGGVAGTIQYLSPQYLEGGEVSALGDIYALGTIAYELVTGVMPYAGVSVFQLIELKVSSDPVPPQQINPDCPMELSHAIMRALSRDPKARFQTAMEFAAALGKIPVTQAPELGPPIQLTKLSQQEAQSRPTRRRSQLLRIGVGGVALGVLVFMLMFGALPRMVGREASDSDGQLVAKQPLTEFQAGPNTSDGAQGFVAVPASAQAASDVPANGVDRSLDGSAIYIPSIVRLSVDASKQKTRVFDVRRRVAHVAVSAEKPVLSREQTQLALSRQETTSMATGRGVAAVVSSSEPPEQEPSAEVKVRGTLLYRLADYVDWPQRAFSSGDSPFQICLIGSDPFGASFERLVERMISKAGRGFSLQRLAANASGGQLKACQVLYVPQELNSRSADILSSLRKLPILTVTDGSEEGIIDFMIQDRKVKFSVNKRRAREAGLTVGSLLLDLAAKVTE